MYKSTMFKSATPPGFTLAPVLAAGAASFHSLRVRRSPSPGLLGTVSALLVVFSACCSGLPPGSWGWSPVSVHAASGFFDTCSLSWRNAAFGLSPKGGVRSQTISNSAPGQLAMTLAVTPGPLGAHLGWSKAVSLYSDKINVAAGRAVNCRKFCYAGSQAASQGWTSHGFSIRPSWVSDWTWAPGLATSFDSMTVDSCDLKQEFRESCRKGTTHAGPWCTSCEPGYEDATGSCQDERAKAFGMSNEGCRTLPSCGPEDFHGGGPLIDTSRHFEFDFQVQSVAFFSDKKANVDAGLHIRKSTVDAGTKHLNEVVTFGTELRCWSRSLGATPPTGGSWWPTTSWSDPSTYTCAADKATDHNSYRALDDDGNPVPYPDEDLDTEHPIVYPGTGSTSGPAGWLFVDERRPVGETALSRAYAATNFSAHGDYLGAVETAGKLDRYVWSVNTGKWLAARCNLSGQTCSGNVDATSAGGNSAAAGDVRAYVGVQTYSIVDEPLQLVHVPARTATERQQKHWTFYAEGGSAKLRTPSA